MIFFMFSKDDIEPTLVNRAGATGPVDIIGRRWTHQKKDESHEGIRPGDKIVLILR